LDWRFSVAPMMGWTDRHERYFLRQLSRRAVLYTEMINAGAIVYGAKQRFLQHHPSEHPVALQLGDSDPARMAQAARDAEEAGFDEVNINCGCPSDRGTHRLFGAHLMKHPELVADCYQAMAEAVSIPVTIKTRIGIDREDSYEPLLAFVEEQARAGCKMFHVHARKAWLDGLSCKENRDVPPLRYEYVYRLKRERPDLTITINGGIATLEQCRAHLQHVDGVMLGREAYHNPFLLSQVDEALYGDAPSGITRESFLDAIEPYLREELARGCTLHSMVRHLLGLYQGQPGARVWRRILSEDSTRPGSGIEVFHRAREAMEATRRQLEADRCQPATYPMAIGL
jgi:tRNA-dihydrouridine synthase A